MIKVTLPYPPSVNRYLRFSPKGFAYTTAEAKSYKQGAKLRALTQGLRPIVDKEVVLSIAVYRPRRIGDIDNVLKVLLDSLNGVAYTDDSQIVELHISRNDDAANPRVEIWVSEREGNHDAPTRRRKSIKRTSKVEG